MRDRKVIGVSGSKYHDSLDTAIDKAVIEALGGKFYDKIHNVTVKETGTVINIAHGASNPMVGRGGNDDRESLYMDANFITMDIDLVVRGHWHYYQYLQNSSRAVLRVPGWQAWYPAKFMVDNIGRKNQMLGSVCMDFFDKKVFYPIPRLYVPPKTWNKAEEI